MPSVAVTIRVDYETLFWFSSAPKGMDGLCTSTVGNTNSPARHNKARKRVAIRRDDKDFVVVFQPEDVVIVRRGM